MVSEILPLFSDQKVHEDKTGEVNLTPRRKKSLGSVDVIIIGGILSLYLTCVNSSIFMVEYHSILNLF